MHGVCSLDYYRAAFSEICSRVPDPHFFVFSDDTAWARANISLSERVTYVDHNGGDRSYEDLRLMTKCRNHIIANSTFSWWGAWLGAAPKQVVIAPRLWFAVKNDRARDLYPSQWLRL
jgi:hypothetical protein